MSALTSRPALDRQAKRIRWQHGVTDHTARVIAGLCYGEVRR